MQLLRHLVAKDLRRAWRNPWPWLLNLAIPLVLTALLGLAFGGGDGSSAGSIGRIHVAVVDESTRLQHALAVECDPHPCPGCGWYQQDMVQHLREASFASGAIWGAVLINGPVVCLALAGLCAELPGWWGVVLPLILVVAAGVLLAYSSYRVYRGFFARINCSHAYDEVAVRRTR